MKYPKLEGICEIAIKNKLCLGCMKLENPLFRGQAECNLVIQPREKIKQILEIGEQMKI